MRYFLISADERNPLPQINGWFKVVNPGLRSAAETYQLLAKRIQLTAELRAEWEFPDILNRPHFMVKMEFANLIHTYDPSIRFKSVILADKENKRTAIYRIPDLPELDCLSDDSKRSKDKSQIEKGILCGDKIQGYSIFNIKDVSSKYVIASLPLVESAYRRKVVGMKIEEFIVQ